MIRIGGPTTTIDTPLEQLTACHRRIEDRLATLGRAADHWRNAPEAALEAIRKSIQFLDSNGVLHTMDEEASLFPRLRSRLSGEEAAHLDRLEQQHHEVESLLAELKDVVAGIAASPQQAIPLEIRYREVVTRLSGLYRPHIQFEDEILMPLARRVLDQGSLENISQEMKTRRQKAEGDSSNIRVRQNEDRLLGMDELARRVLKVFIEMGSESLDLHTLFEAGGNDPASRKQVLDVVMRLIDTGHLESQGSDFYLLTRKGRSAAVESSPS
jgi:hemerythrin-like domain-containing protein